MSVERKNLNQPELPVFTYAWYNPQTKAVIFGKRKAKNLAEAQGYGLEDIREHAFPVDQKGRGWFHLVRDMPDIDSQTFQSHILNLFLENLLPTLDLNSPNFTQIVVERTKDFIKINFPQGLKNFYPN